VREARSYPANRYRACRSNENELPLRVKSVDYGFYFNSSETDTPAPPAGRGGHGDAEHGRARRDASERRPGPLPYDSYLPLRLFY
jgi:hypothetical protein